MENEQSTSNLLRLPNGLFLELDLNQNKAYIAKADCSDNEIIIPSKINYQDHVLILTKIKSDSFQFNRKFSKIIFEEDSQLEIIEPYAFSDSSLIEIQIPASICELEGFCARANSFQELHISDQHPTFIHSHNLIITKNDESCIIFASRKLNSVSIPADIKRIGHSSFSSCKELQMIEFLTNSDGLNSLTEISQFAFSSCISLKSITFPPNLTRIMNDSFAYCKGLEEIICMVDSNGNSSIEKIGDRAFDFCENLKQVSIPSSVKTIGSSAFENCSKLHNIDFTLNKNNESQLEEICKNAFSFCSQLESISIPATVKYLEDSSFSFCGLLKKLSFMPVLNSLSHIEEIRDYSFDFCERLKTVSIPATVKRLGSGVFAHCKALETVEFLTNTDGGSDMIEIGDSAFSLCFSLESITIPSTVRIIGKEAFKYCIKLATVDFQPNGESQLEEIRDFAFYRCAKLKSIILPPTLKKIGQSAFSSCQCLEELTFLGVELSQLEEISDSAFYQCKKLPSITIPSSVRIIHSKAFYLCNNLDFIHFLTDSNGLSHLETIGDSAFFNCNKLKIVDIPASIKSVHSGGISYCSQLKSVTFLSDVTHQSFLQDLSYSSFFGNGNLRSISIPITNHRFSVYNNLFIIEKNQLGDLDNSTIIFALNKLKKAVVPPFIKTIGSCAFSACKMLESFIVDTDLNGQANLKEIKSKAFGKCLRLRSVSIPTQLQDCCPDCFDDCKSLSILSICDSPIFDTTLFKKLPQKATIFVNYPE